MIEFFIPMRLPTVTIQEHGVGVNGKGKGYIYDTQEIKAAKALFRDHLAKFAPAAPFDRPVKLHTIWCYDCGDTHHDGEWKITKPDTDNSLKMLKDVMTKLRFWHDDAQVASEITQKLWRKVPGLYVAVEELS